jgi:hypothetical protein
MYPGTLASFGSVASKVMGESESITDVPNTFLLANKVTKQCSALYIVARNIMLLHPVRLLGKS